MNMWRPWTSKCQRILTLGIIATSAVNAQTVLSQSAYRVFGQPDLRQNSVNHTVGAELSGPNAIATGARNGVLSIYVADSRNNRVLIWRDISKYTAGQAADVALGQTDLSRTTALGIGPKGFNFPLAVAVDPIRGDLYVSDFGNNRVVRYRAPFDASSAEPDAVYGQPDFATFSNNSGGLGAGTLRAPQSVAFDPDGNLWISDTGNNRVLRYPRAVLDTTGAQADLVIGQKDFVSGGTNHSSAGISASGFDSPLGIGFDKSGTLYVADFNNTRVLQFKAPLALDAAATVAYGQANLTTRGLPSPPTGSRIGRPSAIAVDDKSLYVASPLDNRVLAFPLDKPAGPATVVYGQPSFATVTPNTGAAPLAGEATLSSPSDVKLDAAGNLWIADSGNNRIVGYRGSDKAASVVLGQGDLWSNAVNRVKPEGMSSTYKVVVDYSQSPFPIYVSDTGNSRVLAWRDVTAYRNGTPADFVIGQPNMNTGAPNIDSGATASAQTLSLPRGLAVDSSGNLFVADSGNNRVLRFPRPVDQRERRAADLVLGQPDLNTFTSANASASLLKSPSAVAIGVSGEIFVSDTGNNRVLEFPADVASSSPAIRVFGQPDFTSAGRPGTPSSQTLDGPQGVAVDASGALYIADTRTNRVLAFVNIEALPATAPAASVVIGQDKMAANLFSAGQGRLHLPCDVAVDGSGAIFVSDTGNNRVLVFPPLLFLPSAAGIASAVIGQSGFGGSVQNWNSPDGLNLRATPEGLANPLGVFVDRVSTLYVADSGNSRVVHFLRPLRTVNAADWQDGVSVAAGSLVTVVGADLSSDSEISDSRFQLSLAQRSMALDEDIPVQLGYVSPSQVNAQIPSKAPAGTMRIGIRNSDTHELIAGGLVSIGKQSPGLFTASQDGKGQALAVNQAGTLNSAAAPAPKGSVVKFFGTGSGAVDKDIEDGAPAPMDVAANTLATPTTDGRTCLSGQSAVCFAIGSTFGEIVFSGLAPGRVGVWEIDVRIPQGALSGAAIPVRAVVNGTPSNIATIAIK